MVPGRVEARKPMRYGWTVHSQCSTTISTGTDISGTPVQSVSKSKLLDGVIKKLYTLVLRAWLIRIPMKNRTHLQVGYSATVLQNALRPLLHRILQKREKVKQDIYAKGESKKSTTKKLGRKEVVRAKLTAIHAGVKEELDDPVIPGFFTEATCTVNDCFLYGVKNVITDTCCSWSAIKFGSTSLIESQDLTRSNSKVAKEVGLSGIFQEKKVMKCKNGIQKEMEILYLRVTTLRRRRVQTRTVHPSDIIPPEVIKKATGNLLASCTEACEEYISQKQLTVKHLQTDHGKTGMCRYVSIVLLFASLHSSGPRED